MTVATRIDRAVFFKVKVFFIAVPPFQSSKIAELKWYASARVIPYVVTPSKRAKLRHESCLAPRPVTELIIYSPVNPSSEPFKSQMEESVSELARLFSLKEQSYVERRIADAHLPPDLFNGRTKLGLLHGKRTRLLGKFASLHVLIPFIR